MRYIIHTLDITPFFPVLAETGLRGSSKVLRLPTLQYIVEAAAVYQEIYTTILYRCIRDMLYAKILDTALD